MTDLQFHVRLADPSEFETVGQLMVSVYSQLDGFPKPDEQPRYYELLANIGLMAEKPGVELLIAATDQGQIGGAVVYFSDMSQYGSGGTAPQETDASGFRLLAVDPETRGQGIGKQLTLACIEKAKSAGHSKVVIHTTAAMQRAWAMYERLDFQRALDLDFMQEKLQVYGFRLELK